MTSVVNYKPQYSMQWGYGSSLVCQDLYSPGLMIWPNGQPKKKSLISSNMSSYCLEGVNTPYQEFCIGKQVTRPTYGKYLPLWVMSYDQCKSACERRGMTIPCYHQRDRNFDINGSRPIMPLLYTVGKRWPLDSMSNEWHNIPMWYDSTLTRDPLVHVSVNIPSWPQFRSNAACPQMNDYDYYYFGAERGDLSLALWYYSSTYYGTHFNVEARDPVTSLAVCVCGPR
jgi:hypothetical protein